MTDDKKKDLDSIDLIFDSLDTESKGYVKKNEFVNALKLRGMSENDRRLKGLIDTLNKHYYENNKISRSAFRKLIAPNITIIERTLTGQLVIPDFKNFSSFITNIYNRTKLNKEGEVSDYLPQLKDVDPKNYAISICTVDGQQFNIGDYNTPFNARELSGPINYCAALEEYGEAEVHKKIGMSPKEQGNGNMTLNKDGIPPNPFCDSGALLCASLIKPKLDVESRFIHLTELWSFMSGGRELGFNKQAFLSEKLVADKYYALAHFMKEKKLFAKNANLDDYADLLFNCFSIETTTETLAIVASTLANAGLCPTNGRRRVLDPETTKNCLSLMYSCGLGDYSSEFSFSVGLPAQSGISGGVMLVIPNVLGAAIYSPRIDSNGISIKGINFCKRLVERFNFHNYDSLSSTKASKKIDPRFLENKVKIEELNGCLDAASNGDVYELQRLLAKGADLGGADYDLRTGLHLAASEGHLETVRFLIEHKVDVNPKDRWGGTPLEDATRYKHEKVAELLKSNGGRL